MRNFWEYKHFANKDILKINLILLKSIISLRRDLLASKNILKIRSILLVSMVSLRRSLLTSREFLKTSQFPFDWVWFRCDEASLRIETFWKLDRFCLWVKSVRGFEPFYYIIELWMQSEVKKDEILYIYRIYCENKNTLRRENRPIYSQ
jgi:hypothetical protein